ncbi:MAG TPA: folate-binding protein [Burkholderiaceae bacterium]|nr:folate-binding protein [Burkholderiaceae bacterium]
MPDDPTTATHGGTWNAPADQLFAVLRGPVLAALDELGVVEVRGADAEAFLQNQLTADIAAVEAGRLQAAGCCTPKGRLLATFRLWRGGDATVPEFCLLTPREVLAPALTRLAMFVLRAKVKLADASANWKSYALAGPGTTEQLTAVGVDAPAVGLAVRHEGALLARLPDAPRVAERFLLIVPAERAAAWQERLQFATAVDSGVFWWTQIDAGVPDVFAATREKFVPQMINFEVLGGVSFKKGCYPGQEIVARSQYLGKLRRRMSIAHTGGTTCAGANVFAAGEAQPIGVVVMAAATPEGGMDVLLERPVDRAVTLHAGAADGPILTERALPYALFDPTA